ncbi:hypothetical protein [Nisaea sp.]|uniref:hypothetical protein n=1 Tax=Nisaea sp. TaxID=2024842 RepID=UPI003B52CD8F
MTKKTSQAEKFKEAARELGADKNEDRFDEAMKRLVKKGAPQKNKTPPKRGFD